MTGKASETSGVGPFIRRWAGKISKRATTTGLVLGVSIFSVVCSVLLAWTWVTDWRHIQSTNNAYVQGDITAIRPKVSGYVQDLYVTDNQAVRKGDPLLRIEDEEIRQQIAGVDAELARLDAELLALGQKKALQSLQIDQASADVAIAEAEQERTRAELARSKRLAQAGNTSKQAHEIAIATHRQAMGASTRATARLEAAKLETTVLDAEEQKLKALVQKTRAERNILKIHLDDTVLRAPIDGVIGNRTVRAGQLVEPGRFLMAVVPLNDVWVVGNFKETQLTRVREGQPVTIHVDTFPGAEIKGVVAGMSPASGAEFSILPPQNASGNFTKIVQRIPVKITIDPSDGMRGLLRPGMSCTVSIDTKQSRSENQVAASN